MININTSRSIMVEDAWINVKFMLAPEFCHQVSSPVTTSENNYIISNHILNWC